ncbi:MAG: hypothetical protein JWM68_505 [Verrucomicrobiales bacterium]|nr:hypothetical protein [Verrucomicrobiales bacterium]
MILRVAAKLSRFASVGAWAVVISLCAGTSSGAAQKDAVDFGAQVRPIISAKCFHCHGPDEGSRKAKLRLDLRDEALKERKGGIFPIKPGSPEQSEMIRRISSSDPEEVMPPSKESHAVTSSEIALLKKWIQQGAPYETHWAFKKPEQPALPKVKSKRWAKNAIDSFILAKIEAAKLKPSPPAERATLIRRLALDLTGLPPTPAEVEAFVKDKSPNAYEKVIDRLLASPAYGERWARMWMDIARYADSAGYGSDPLRLGIWPYREWVIKAFNRNMPFDQFTTEQLAGDLLENSTEEQRTATAFHRNTMTNTEGGTDDEEWRVAAVKDRANITAQAWMGLTMGCAQCHTHKFDPITHKEYYQFYAFFNQTEDDDKGDEHPTLPLPTKAEREKIQGLNKQISDLEKKIEGVSPELLTEFSAWEKIHGHSNAWTILDPIEFKATTNAVVLKKLSDQSVLASGEAPGKDTYTIKLHSATEFSAIRLETLTDESLPKNGPGRSKKGAFVLNNFRVTFKPDKDAATNRVIALKNPTATYSEKKYDIALAIDDKADKKSGWSIDGGQGREQSAVFETAEKLPPGTLTVELAQDFGMKNTIGRFRISVAALPAPVVAIPSEISSILTSEARSEEGKQKLVTWFQQYAVSTKKLREQINSLKKDVEGVQPVAVPVMTELPKDKFRTTHILSKGSYLSPADEVTPGIPAAFNAWPKNAPMNRLGVAKWVMSPENPLTARVMANRFWAQIFGVGIVETEEDFGTQGSLPSHPELLDWLAVDLRDHGWDVKRFLKTVVMSATYQQSSRLTPELLQKDPRNRLLARAPRRRLDAEVVRDQALSVSGLLSHKLGGPSVYPPQPDGLWRAAFNGQRTYATSTGEDRYRRGIYTIWRRTVPYPSMATFDAPSRESCTFRRLPTNTPLQAYVTLNDPVYVEAAQALGRRLVQEGGATIEERIRFGLRLALSRQATKEETAALVDLFKSELTRYQANEKDALDLATKPLGPLPKGLNAPEAAAWTVIGNVLLNLDGVLMKG